MTQTNDCILIARNKTGCANCPVTCQHRIATAGRIKAAGAPVSYRHLTMLNSPVRESEPQVYELLDKYVETFNRIFEDEDVEGM